MSEITSSGNRFSTFRNFNITQKLFFIVILVQFILFSLLLLYNAPLLLIKNDRYNRESHERYVINTSNRIVFNRSKTTTRFTTTDLPVLDEVKQSVQEKSEPIYTVPRCPLFPPYLRGKYSVDLTNYNEKVLMKRLRLVGKGGVYKPKTCRSRHKVAIIIPYRDRKEHLHKFLNNLHPFLQKQQLDYRVFVIELAPNVVFNRALCLNIGFVEAVKKYDYECFIFHDVDLIPENDNNLYTCSENPKHMSVAIDKFNYKLPYMSIFGGVTAMTKDQFELVNGYSNKFFGWGGEDDDMYSRIRNLGVSITRYTEDVGTYRMLKHGPDQNLNEHRFTFLSVTRNRWSEDGLNTIKYRALMTAKNLYTYILADINPDDTAYQPWTKGRGNGSLDDSLEHGVEELLMEKAKYLLNKFVLDEDFVNKLKREFLFLNTSVVNTQIVAGLIRKLYPTKSPVPIQIPHIIESSGQNSSQNPQTTTRSNDSQRNQLATLNQTEGPIKHTQMQLHDQKSSTLVHAQYNNKKQIKPALVKHQNQTAVHIKNDNIVQKVVQKQLENKTSVTNFKTIKKRNDQIPVQYVETKGEKEKQERKHTTHTDQTRHENKDSGKQHERIVYRELRELETFMQKVNQVSIQNDQNNKEGNKNPLNSKETQQKNMNFMHSAQPQQEIRRPINSTQAQHDNKTSVLSAQPQQEIRRPINSTQAQHDNKTSVHSAQPQQEIRRPINSTQAQHDNKISVHSAQPQQEIRRPINSTQAQHDNKTSVHSAQPQQGIKRLKNPSQTQQEHKTSVNLTELQQESRRPVTHVQSQQDNKSSVHLVQPQQESGRPVTPVQTHQGNKHSSHFGQAKEGIQNHTHLDQVQAQQKTTKSGNLRQARQELKHFISRGQIKQENDKSVHHDHAQEDNQHPIHSSESHQENRHYTQQSEASRKNKKSAQPGQPPEDNKQPIHPGQAHEGSSVHAGQLQQKNKNSNHFGQVQQENGYSINFNKVPQENPYHIDPSQASAQQKTQNSAHPSQSQQENRHPIRPGQAQAQQENRRPINPDQAPEENKTFVQPGQAQQGNQHSNNPSEEH